MPLSRVAQSTTIAISAAQVASTGGELWHPGVLAVSVPWSLRGPPTAGLRIGTRRPSGRPGTRWLRACREPLSTERRGPIRVAPADRAKPSRTAGAPRLGLAPSGVAPVRHTAPDPVAFGEGRGGCRTDVLWWTPPNLPAPGGSLSTAVRPAPLSGNSRSDGKIRRSPCDWAVHARGLGTSVRHSFGRLKTVRPATTVSRHSGSGRPGVRSGSPGVPERGSVDQRDTRSSGAWTISSPVRQTA